MAPMLLAVLGSKSRESVIAEISEQESRTPWQKAKAIEQTIDDRVAIGISGVFQKRHQRY